MTPSSNASTSGVYGAAYLPFSQPYVLTNTASNSAQWFATSTKPWLLVTQNSGVIAAGGQASVGLWIDAQQADALGPGTYTASLLIYDLTYATSTSRSVTLQIAASGAQLSVYPGSGFNSTGPAGGPFTPGTQTYAFANLGSRDMSWRATTSASWLKVSRSSGVAFPGVLEELDVSIDASRTTSLAPGIYSATLSFENLTNGAGDLEYTFNMTVMSSPATLSVSSAGAFFPSGPVGGPFSPSTMKYTLTNEGAGPLVWSISRTQSWILPSSTLGTLNSGQSTDVWISANPYAANSLGIGAYSGAVTFNNTTNNLGTTSRTAQLTVTAATTTMQVVPASGLVTSGPPGGRFVPDQKQYTITNTGNASMEWSASVNASWVMLTATQGTLAPGGQASLLAMIDQQQAAGFLPGSYSATVFINNDTDGTGSTVRTVQLDVTAAGPVLSITPATDFTTTGSPGGPFTPSTRTYFLRNLSTAPLAWSASVQQSWVELSSGGGTIAPGAQVGLTVSVDEAGTAGLPLGLHNAWVAFRDLTNGAAVQTRKVRLSLVGSGASSRSAISQFGITWTFDRAYPAGQFANGDWWVQGPVEIIDIDPPSVSSGGRVMNGSMVNPNPRTQSQGYDSAMYAQYSWPAAYDDELNVALNVSASNPLILGADNSMISSVSRTQAGLRPQLHAAAILTVVGGPVPVGSFRPAYCGHDKSIEFNESQLDESKLASLPSVASTPSLSVVEQWFERPWIDHIPDWVGRYAHPLENMPDYGREICDRIGTASLMLHLDFTPAQKRKLLVRLVQVGIDFYGIVEAGGRNNWPAGGGHHSGRKWPILFAGLMLNDVDMGLIGFDDNVAFNEDDQTFVVEETSPNVYNYGFGSYGPQHEGLPEWGNQHAKNLGQDSSEWFGNPYRVCCTAHVWWGELLSAYIMGARPLWNHEPLFDYQDRYLETANAMGQARWSIGWTVFPLEMWETYRDDY